MKIISWNVNSVRARIENIKSYLLKYKPDVVMMQEIKTEDINFPYDDFASMDYESHVFGQKSYNGVAIISKEKLKNIKKDLIKDKLKQSRIISAEEERDYKEFTSEQTEDDNSRNKSKRSDIRVKDFEETKLLNFYNLGGIRFQNIVANDALISSKINTMVSEGWELAFVSSAVESDAGKNDGNGIFITRYIFKRNK